MKRILLLTLLLVTGFFAKATPPDEGMWLPMFVERMNYEDMKKHGLKLTPKEIYDINNSSLKDAIVMLGRGFCTAEMVSDQGLVLTNHHCAYDMIQSHSSVENDYLTDGFWAMKKEDELAESWHYGFLFAKHGGCYGEGSERCNGRNDRDRKG